MIEELSKCYCQLLMVGFVVLRQAMEANDRDWMDHEIEFLHNIPTLIADPNSGRHNYFWSQERPHYMKWVSAPGHELQRSAMQTYYEPILDSMVPLIAKLADPERTSG
jgi:hypothetical protein